MEQNLFPSVLQLGEQLLAQGLKVAVAESCTGGLISKTLTDVAGSSAWFDRGFITYSNEAKMDMLQVNSDTLEKYGAVSEQTAREMVLGVLQNSRADFAVAVTGIAGPGGGSKDKPVGLVFIAYAQKGKGVNVERKLFSGDRKQVRQQTLQRALTLLIEQSSAV